MVTYGYSHSIGGRGLVLASLTGLWCHVNYLERLDFLAKVLGRAPGEKAGALTSAAWGEQNLPLFLADIDRVSKVKP